MGKESKMIPGFTINVESIPKQHGSSAAVLIYIWWLRTTKHDHLHQIFTQVSILKLKTTKRKYRSFYTKYLYKY